MSWTDTQNFSDRLRWLKAERGWTIEDMCARTELPKGRLERYLAQRHTAEPKLDALVKLSNGLGVSLNWLALGKGPVTMPAERT
ncbi:helix-turn-helix transcriptional regulator [Hoeflea sp. WL0058]|uniref:Helix-turn-helix transcriptional regulator n=1 Tax=Flavimaribacter sediminis TaxID=2865987 RepID=A0AAE2ZLX3_9HYPH|nr:helix-turn-helix transcriptional regulator [Flavimaribacter sediminis]MBW8638958.1 helix-turn-helix transcriptional regulator [Flavimaribacter sediminis]